MIQQSKDILNIVKSGITAKNIKVSDDFSAENVISLIQEHHITTLTYYGLFSSGIEIKPELKNMLFNTVMKETAIDEKQKYYIKKISDAFENNNIDYMLLKGSVLKNLYPQSEIRRMGDIDILIKTEQYDTISNVMSELGFSYKYNGDHDYGWIKGGVLIELHKTLMPPYNKDLHAYFGDGWKRAECIGKCEYTLNNEDMFIYIFSHFVKHYRDAGIGIIHMCDLYVYINSVELDLDYIESELKELKLYDFYCNIRKTLDVWFEDKNSTEMTDHITEVIFNSGVYGICENTFMSNAIKNKNKFENYKKGQMYFVIRTFFPSYKTMKGRYSILKKLPILLPLFWIWRLIVVFTTKHRNVKNKYVELNAVSENKMKAYEKALEYVGLKYNFK